MTRERKIILLLKVSKWISFVISVGTIIYASQAFADGDWTYALLWLLLFGIAMWSAFMIRNTIRKKCWLPINQETLAFLKGDVASFAQVVYSEFGNSTTHLIYRSESERTEQQHPVALHVHTSAYGEGITYLGEHFCNIKDVYKSFPMAL